MGIILKKLLIVLDEDIISDFSSVFDEVLIAQVSFKPDIAIRNLLLIRAGVPALGPKLGM